MRKSIIYGFMGALIGALGMYFTASFAERNPGSSLARWTGLGQSVPQLDLEAGELKLPDEPQPIEEEPIIPFPVQAVPPAEPIDATTSGVRFDQPASDSVPVVPPSGQGDLEQAIVVVPAFTDDSDTRFSRMPYSDEVSHALPHRLPFSPDQTTPAQLVPVPWVPLPVLIPRGQAMPHPNRDR